MKTKNTTLIAACGFITFALGILNSVYKRRQLPPFRFFVGNGLLWLGLMSLDEFEPEIANALALAVVTFVVIGEGGGVLTHYVSNGRHNEFDTRRKAATGSPDPAADSHGGAVVTRRTAAPGSPVPIGVVGLRPLFIPGFTPTPGAVHFPYSGN